MRIGIIGGGASGLITAICSKREDNEVIIFERNKECGKKILVTGNGRCNYWNLDQALNHYQSENKELIKEMIDDDSEKDILSLFNKLGIIPKIKNGYYYPYSNQASTIKTVLIDEVISKDIEIKSDFLVTDIKKTNEGFIVSNSDESIIVDKLVLATGSYAAPKTGSDGMGYKFLKDLGHTIIKPLPSLVQLKGNEKYFKIWTGVRTDAKVTLYENDKKIKEDIGELQLTNYGLSGICIFNLSNYVARGLDKGSNEVVGINFIPFIDDDIKQWFINQTNLTNKNVKKLLLSILNEKIVEVIFSSSNISNKLFTKLSNDEQNKLIELCTDFRINILGTNTFNEAQVCSGGVCLAEINLSTMESKIVKDLYVVGELLDITGDCGGYNLGIAWRTGFKAGKAIRGDIDD